MAHAPVEEANGETPGENPDQRRTDMIFFFNLNQGPDREIHAPPRLEKMIMGVFKSCGLNRRMGAGAEKPGKGDAASLLDIKAGGQWGRAYITIKQYGPDVLEQVRAQLKELSRQDINCIYLDLPLCDPATASWGAAFADLGFFFGGVLPEMLPDGDVLRLQFLNNPPSDLESARISSDWGWDVFDFVKDKYLADGPR